MVISNQREAIVTSNFENGANMPTRYFLANVIVISLSVAFLVHFGLIAYYRRVVISEPRPVIFAMEVAGLTGLMAFAILSLAKQAPAL